MKPPLSERKRNSLLSVSINKSEGVLMLPDTVIRRLKALGEISQQGKRINGLFRLMEQPILWYEAYATIDANERAMTPGVDGTTLDGFSEARVAAIIKQLKEGTYHFKPVRRTSVPKPNGKKRPLGISSGNDTLVQEVVRRILENIYEPVFENSSHGFRPGRSPHTAREHMEKEWTAVKWIIDMDLRRSFDTIPHDLLVGLRKKKREDKRFIRLIQAMLDAGYLEDWTYHAAYSGVPQGSICAPILANVSLHERDLFMKTLKEQFETGKRRRANLAYARYSDKICARRKKWDTLKEKGGGKEDLRALQRHIKTLQRQRRPLPSKDPCDGGYKRLYSLRYADDYVIGIIGPKSDAERVRKEVRHFLEQRLKMTIAEEKSHIRHSKQGVIFGGYWAKTYSGNRIVKVKWNNCHTTMKSVSERFQLHIPKNRLQKFCLAKRYGNYQRVEALHTPEWNDLRDAEIILAYNGELRGLTNYYALAHGVKRNMGKLAFIWEQSLFKTLANKHKESMNKGAKRLKTGEGHALVIHGEKKTRIIKLFRMKDLTPPAPNNPGIDIPPNTFALTLSRSELIRRLNTSECEYGGTQHGPFEVHHVRRLKDIAKGKEPWQRLMIARQRKTLILCMQCHQQLHVGTLPGRTHPSKEHVKGELDA
jgi:RNA-directed DNA polymerase